MMNDHAAATTAPRSATPGQLAFAVTLVALGIGSGIKGAFAPIWNPLPGFLPELLFVYLTAAVSVVAGIGLLLPRTALPAARLFLGLTLAWFVIIRLPWVPVSPTIDVIWSAGEMATIVGAVWTLFVRLSGGRGDGALAWMSAPRGVRIARCLYGAGLIPFGVAHFWYLPQTTVLVPAWLGWPLGWAYFTGAAFVGAGLAIIFGVYARLAALLVTLQIAGFTLLVWVPIVLRGATPGQLHEAIASWVLITIAWVFTESYRGTPWIARHAPL